MTASDPEQLTAKRCIPCEGGSVMPLSIQEGERLIQQVSGWGHATDWRSIHKDFRFASFLDAIHFVNEAARLAEEEGHHPDLDIRYNRVSVNLTTHAIGGLSLNDFIMAAKLDSISV